MNTEAVMSNLQNEQIKTPISRKIIVMTGMVSLMGGTITCAMTYMNVGMTETFFHDWAVNFLTALVTVIPFGMLMMTLLTKMAEKRLPHISAKARDAIVGICMALIMESGMALTSAYNSVGFTSQSEFASAWINGVLGALPVALVLMVTVSTTIKPRIEQFLKS